MMPFDSTFANRLAAKLKEQDETNTQNLRTGALSEPNYRKAVGNLRALDDVKGWMREIEKELNQGK